MNVFFYTGTAISKTSMPQTNGSGKTFQGCKSEGSQRLPQASVRISTVSRKHPPQIFSQWCLQSTDYSLLCQDCSYEISQIYLLVQLHKISYFFVYLFAMTLPPSSIMNGKDTELFINTLIQGAISSLSESPDHLTPTFLCPYVFHFLIP